MKTVNSHNSSTYASTCGVLVVLLFGIFAISCNNPAISRENVEKPTETAVGGVLDLNSANAAELEKLPGVGPKLAQAIIEFRSEHGPFEKPEHLILVPGMSDARFRALRKLVTTN